MKVKIRYQNSLDMYEVFQVVWKSRGNASLKGVLFHFLQNVIVNSDLDIHLKRTSSFPVIPLQTSEISK